MPGITLSEVSWGQRSFLFWIEIKISSWGHVRLSNLTGDPRVKAF